MLGAFHLTVCRLTIWHLAASHLVASACHLQSLSACCYPSGCLQACCVSTTCPAKDLLLVVAAFHLSVCELDAFHIAVCLPWLAVCHLAASGCSLSSSLTLSLGIREFADRRLSAYLYKLVTCHAACRLGVCEPACLRVVYML